MIIKFSVRNFLSFLSEQSIGFLASGDPAHRATHAVSTPFKALPFLTRTAVITGPNGSGKSNLLVALNTMREFVLHSSTFSTFDFAKHYMPFGSKASQEMPTVFSIETLLNGTRYEYSFAYNAQRVVAEHLRVYESKKAQRWFQRTFDPATQVDTWTPFSLSFHGPREIWRKSTRPQALFLTTAAQLNAEQLAPLVHWFVHQLGIVLSSTVTSGRRLLTRLRDDNFKSKMLGVLQAVDIPAVNLRLTDLQDGKDDESISTRPGDTLAAHGSIELQYHHGGLSPVWLSMERDSAGAHRLLAVLEPIIDGAEKDRFIVIDDFDALLHPLVAQFVVRLINNPSVVHGRVQVMLVSHSVALLDLDMLRRDELWLMELDNERGSRLSTLAHHGIRKHESIARAYLRGKYGALPCIDPTKLFKEIPHSNKLQETPI